MRLEEPKIEAADRYYGKDQADKECSDLHAPCPLVIIRRPQKGKSIRLLSATHQNSSPDAVPDNSERARPLILCLIEHVSGDYKTDNVEYDTQRADDEERYTNHD